MPSPYSVVDTDLGVNDKTLSANTADVVNFQDDVDRVEVITDGSAAVYVTADGTTPTISGNNTMKIPASSNPISRSFRCKSSAGATQVQLISGSAVVYSCIKDQG